MLEPNELYVVADQMTKIYEKLNRWAVIDMAERIMEMQELDLNNLPGTVQHLAWVSRQSGMHYQDMLKRIEKITDIGSEELHKLFQDSAVKAIENDREAYKNLSEPTGIKTWNEMSDSNKQIVEAMYERTEKQMENFTRTTARTNQQQLHEAIDTAYNEIMLGYKSASKAIADAIEKVAKKGTMVMYESGYKDSIETCIRRAVMTGINQTAGQISIKNALELGAEYVKISSHSTARVSADKIANHSGWQGKIYKLKGKTKKYGNLFEETGFDYEGKKSNPLGLCGYNCRHTINAYFPKDEEEKNMIATSQDEKEKREKEEREHKQQVKEREENREEAKLIRVEMAYKEAIDMCKDLELKKELKSRLHAIEEQRKCVVKKYKTGIIKNIEVPTEISNIAGITRDTENEIRKAFETIPKEYNVKIDTVTVESLGNDLQNVPFQYIPVNRGGYLQAKIVINKDYYFNDSLEAYQARIMRNHNKKILAAKTVEDLIAHEMAHVMTFQHCSTYGEFLRVEEEVRELHIMGISGYADASLDGAETIAEAFIKYRRGEELPGNVLELINKYIERWRK